MLKCLSCVGKVWDLAGHPSRAWDGSCSAHSRGPLLQRGYSPVTADEGKYHKNRYFPDGQQRKGLHGVFCSRFGDQAEICGGLCPSHRRAFVPKSRANIGSDWEGCWREDVNLVEFLQPWAASPPSPSAVPPVRPPGCAAAGCLSWDLVMMFIYSSALMSSFGEGWGREDCAF